MSQPIDKLRALSRRGFIAGTAMMQILVPGSASASARLALQQNPSRDASRRLFIELAGTDIPRDVEQIATCGYAREGAGAASYVHDPAADSGYAAANPHTAFQAADGRVFRLGRERVTPFMMGAVGDGIADDTTALQTFADFMVNNQVNVVEATGRFAVSRTILWGKPAGRPASKLSRGNLEIHALGPVQEVIRFRNMGRTRWLGDVSVTGTGEVDYAGRTCAVGVAFQNCGRMHFSGGIQASRFHFAGIAAHEGNNTLLDVGNCTFTDVGSGHRIRGTAASLGGQWSGPTNNGGSGSASQRTTIRVSTLFPEGIEEYGRVGNAPIQIRINNYLYFVYAVDRGAGTATIYPWLDPAAGSAGTFEWVLGGGLYLYGADTNVVTFGQADCIRCGRGVAAASLYAPTADRLVTQFTGTALLFGRQPAGAVLGGYIRGLYCENNREDICALSRQGNGFYNRVGSAYGLNLAKCWATGDARSSAGLIIGGEFRHLPIPFQGRILEFEKDNRFRPNTRSVDFSAGSGEIRTYRRNGWKIEIGKLDRNLHRLKGYSGGRLLFESPTRADGAPTGTFTFEAPKGGTVNGEASVQFSSFSGPALFSVEIADPGAEAWTVRVVSGKDRAGLAGVEVIRDADAVLTSSSKSTQIYDQILTSGRTLRLPPGGSEGRKFRIVRSAPGEFDLQVASATGTVARTLAVGEWSEFEDDGQEYRLTASGSL